MGQGDRLLCVFFLVYGTNLVSHGTKSYQELLSVFRPWDKLDSVHGLPTSAVILCTLYQTHTSDIRNKTSILPYFLIFFLFICLFFFKVCDLVGMIEN